jgi:DNA repair ATPase RecN
VKHGKTMETKLNEIYNVLSVKDNTLKQFAEKISELNNMKNKMLQSVQSVISDYQEKIARAPGLH